MYIYILYMCVYIYIYIYYAHFASVRFEHSVCPGSLVTTYDYIYMNISRSCNT